jgi:hypothetical protein
VEKLEEWIAEQEIHREVDTELLLDAIERLENAQNDILLKFYDNYNFILGDFERDKHLSNELKLFIREKCFILKEKINYLKPILKFINHYNTLDIFSTNYDNSIEQFCEVYNIKWVDGLDLSGWNAAIFSNLDEGIRLYKLHGSIIWRQTKEGEYVRFPVLTTDENITLSSGVPMVPFIVYPGKKLEYSESAIDTLTELNKQLRNIKYVFVVGYSFKDEHITRLFQYAAKRNTELTLYLVSPSAYQIYEEELKFYRDGLFIENFSHPETSGSNTPSPLHSHLQGRVICLPYKFGKLLPKLSKYLENLVEAQKLDSDFIFAEPHQDMLRWKKRMMHYLDCEHMEKVEKILDEEINWDKLVSEDWKFSFSLSITGLLNRLPMMLNQAKGLEKKWKDYFDKVSEIFSVNKFIFVPEVGHGNTTIPHRITLEFNTPSGKIQSYHLSHPNSN